MKKMIYKVIDCFWIFLENFNSNSNLIKKKDFSTNNDTKQSSANIVVPPTPRATPSPQPIDQEEENNNNSIDESFVTPPLPSPKQPPVVNVVNTSVQCDPIILPPPLPPAPAPIEKNQPKKRLDQTKPTLINIISETLNSNDDDLTESTKYETNSSSTTLSTTTNTEPTTTTASEITESLNEESYFSDGAWLMSKSEGEIMMNDNNNKNDLIVNLDMKRAINSVYLNPHKRVVVDDEEDGELKLEQINQVNMMLLGGSKSEKATTGVNRIMRQSELGEVNRGVSEGELETKTVSHHHHHHSLTKKSKSKKKHDQDKTKISLRIEDESTSIKNKIKIQPLNIPTTTTKPNETLSLINMNDFERRMYSSTPDSSMILNNPKKKRNKTKQVKKRKRKKKIFLSFLIFKLFYFFFLIFKKDSR